MAYAKVRGEVRWNGTPMRTADASTFEILSDTWGKDARHVYCQTRRMKADVVSFVALGRIFAKDRDHVYEHSKVVETADATTFELVPSEHEEEGGPVRTFARDHTQVFYKELTTGKASS